MRSIGSSVVMRFVVGAHLHLYTPHSQQRCVVVAYDVMRSMSMLSYIDVRKWVIDVPCVLSESAFRCHVWNGCQE